MMKLILVKILLSFKWKDQNNKVLLENRTKQQGYNKAFNLFF
jgi:hypothetical protein